MSARNTLEAKAARRRRRALTKGTLPAKIDLVDYIRLRTRCTAGEARRALMAGVLRVDSHPLGTRTVNGKKELAPLIDAKLRSRILVVKPKDEN